MKLRRCPTCGKPKSGIARFCCWCGTKVPPGTDIDQAIREVELETKAQMPFLSIRHKCTEERHRLLTKLMEWSNETELVKYSTGERTTPPTPLKHCDDCGKKLIEGE